MAFSPVGRTKVAVHVFLLLVNVVVLALSTRVNLYQEFFFVADRFPFILSIITLVLLGLMTLVDFVSNSSYTGRPQFEIGVFSVLSIFWLAFNAFSSSRWGSAPLNCGVIPRDYPDTIQWCQELSALRIMVWIEWLIFFFTTIMTLRYTISQSNGGNKHIFQMPLSRYTPRADHVNGNYPFSSNAFEQYGKMN
ncbi:hypothetical protein FB45DRAFT_928552 [Roridomyces roridus]|uniref:MARVEL domain-containing protein n=1 Tax=Roridomyces roridus TaxID=1738132 RepID=A0AAD7FHY8_9AGAR|nr:hypothetical protein FB45DRAFT_928552 [Roridomyces roridus]